jgi:hypothetical protein
MLLGFGPAADAKYHAIAELAGSAKTASGCVRRGPEDEERCEHKDKDQEKRPAG